MFGRKTAAGVQQQPLMAMVLEHGGAEKIERAVVQAEEGTSAEIMVRLTASTPAEGDMWDIAVAEFRRLGLETAAGENAVLVYVSLNRRVVEVVAGRLANEVIGQDTWQATASKIASGFKSGCPADAIAESVGELGQLMHQHFPPTGEPETDLPNVTED